MKNRIARIKWMIVLMFAFAWKFEVLESTGKIAVPITRITIEKVKKINTLLKTTNNLGKQYQSKTQTPEVKEALGLLTLVRF